MELPEPWVFAAIGSSRVIGSVIFAGVVVPRVNNRIKQLEDTIKESTANLDHMRYYESMACQDLESVKIRLAVCCHPRISDGGEGSASPSECSG